MTKNKIAILAVLPLLYAGAASAQAPAEHQPGDMAAHVAQMCTNHVAEVAAKLAFAESKLELTDAQKPLFAKWRQAIMDSANKHKASCLAMAPKVEAHPTILDQQSHEEMMLAARLETLKASHPALQALYDSLNPEQRKFLDQAHHHAMMMHHGEHGGMRPGMDQH